MTPKKFDIRSLPEWSRALLKTKDVIISNLQQAVDEQEIKYETLLRSMENGNRRISQRD